MEVISGPGQQQVKEESCEESRDEKREPDAATSANDGVANLTPPNGSTAAAVVESLADEIEQDLQKLKAEKNLADTDARLAREK